MCHGDDHSLGLTGQIEYVEWESLKDKLASSMLGQWITASEPPGFGRSNC